MIVSWRFTLTKITRARQQFVEKASKTLFNAAASRYTFTTTKSSSTRSPAGIGNSFTSAPSDVITEPIKFSGTSSQPMDTQFLQGIVDNVGVKPSVRFPITIVPALDAT